MKQNIRQNKNVKYLILTLLAIISLILRWKFIVCLFAIFIVWAPLVGFFIFFSWYIGLWIRTNISSCNTDKEIEKYFEKKPEWDSNLWKSMWDGILIFLLKSCIIWFLIILNILFICIMCYRNQWLIGGETTLLIIIWLIIIIYIHHKFKQKISEEYGKERKLIKEIAEKIENEKNYHYIEDNDINFAKIIREKHGRQKILTQFLKKSFIKGWSLCLILLWFCILWRTVILIHYNGFFWNCNIKGNISFETWEKIYHTTDCKDYNSVKIDKNNGERWFCSQVDANDLWRRKSKNCR